MLQLLLLTLFPHFFPLTKDSLAVQNLEALLESGTTSPSGHNQAPMDYCSKMCITWNTENQPSPPRLRLRIKCMGWGTLVKQLEAVNQDHAQTGPVEAFRRS